MLTIAEIKSRIALIQEAADKDDFDHAHWLEDKLYRDVLLFIATEPLICEGDMRLLADAALKSLAIRFERKTA